jgi:hypothetical protein
MNSRLLMVILRASFFGLVKVTRWREQRTRFSLKGTMQGDDATAGLKIGGNCCNLIYEFFIQTL